MVKIEGYNENYCFGGWVGRGLSLGYIEMIFYYEFKNISGNICCIF